LEEFTQKNGWSGFASVVSLHAHTCYSREVLADLPRYIQQIPVVAGCFTRALKAYAEREGCEIDFSRGWWHPPVTPRAVFESEVEQIERRFGLVPLVSVTDHDDIAAGLELQTLYAARRAPVAFEWTVPIGPGFFHVGVHNLPPAHAVEWFARLSAVTAQPRPERVLAAMQDLDAAGDVLIVLNHPMWDLAGVGRQRHASLLRDFCRRYGRSLHALELNGYRSWRENDSVRPLAQEFGLPLVSGGDRHGREPNALLNLSAATSFSEFVREIRDGVSHVIVMPEYRRHLAARKLLAASDVLRRDRSFPPERRHWTGRVSWDDGSGVRALSSHWPDGGPLWVRSAIGAFRIVTNPVVLPVIGAALDATDAMRGLRSGPEWRGRPSRLGVLRMADVNRAGPS
jgi:hypothetical protein